MNSSAQSPVRCDTCNAIVGSVPDWMDPKTWVLCGDCSSKGCEHPAGYLRYIGHALHGSELIWCSRPGCGAIASINGKELQSLPVGRPVLIRAGEDVVERFPEVPLQWSIPSSPLRAEDAARDDQKTVFGVAPPPAPEGPSVASLKPKRVTLGAPAPVAPGVTDAAEAMESFAKDRTVSQEYLEKTLGPITLSKAAVIVDIGCSQGHRGPIRVLYLTRPRIKGPPAFEVDMSSRYRFATLVQCGACGCIGERYGDENENIHEQWAKEI